MMIPDLIKFRKGGDENVLYEIIRIIPVRHLPGNTTVYGATVPIYQASERVVITGDGFMDQIENRFGQYVFSGKKLL
jgi:hypothetical protein|tara:strand:- start:288 stop:518 length:231 start_codon:yes stop_codon:yes gene_type:complete